MSRVTTEDRVAGPYILTGSGQTLSVPFYFQNNSWLLVTSKASVDATVEAPLSIGTHYSVSGAGVPAGGSITLDGGGGYGTAGEIITITLLVPLTMITDYIENDPFPATTHEQQLSKAISALKMVAEWASRAVRFPVSSQGDQGQELPVTASLKNAGWSFDADGKLVTGSGIGPSLAAFGDAQAKTVTPPGSTDFVRFELDADDKAVWVELMGHAPKAGDATGEGYTRIERFMVRKIAGVYSSEAEKTIIKANGSTESFDFDSSVGASGVTFSVNGANLASAKSVEVRWTGKTFNTTGNATAVAL